MKDTFFFQLDNRMHFGLGWSRRLGDFCAEQGWESIALLVDEGVAAHSSYFAEVEPQIAKAVKTMHRKDLRGSEEPSYDYLDELAVWIRGLDDLDAVIAIGGGSTLDTAKALACLRTNDGPAISYRGFDKVINAPIPSICIPTTAGTGSEVTINAVFTDKAEMKKLGINGRHLNATYAVLDAEWTLSCPQSVAVSSGMDALVHTLESFMTTNRNPMTRALNREAFKILFENLPCLVDAPEDTNRRQALLLGSYLAAAGLFNSGSGISGALSYPIGVHYHVPHGIGGGIFIASVVEYNVERGWYEYAELLDMVEPHPEWTAEKKARRLAEKLRELADLLGVPRTLCQWSLGESDLDKLVELIVPLQAAFDQNPIPFDAKSDGRDMLARHLA